jgi:hypothetical protein
MGAGQGGTLLPTSVYREECAPEGSAAAAQTLSDGYAKSFRLSKFLQSAVTDNRVALFCRFETKDHESNAQHYIGRFDRCCGYQRQAAHRPLETRRAGRRRRIMDRALRIGTHFLYEVRHRSGVSGKRSQGAQSEARGEAVAPVGVLERAFHSGVAGWGGGEIRNAGGG